MSSLFSFFLTFIIISYLCSRVTVSLLVTGSSYTATRRASGLESQTGEPSFRLIGDDLYYSQLRHPDVMLPAPIFLLVWSDRLW